MPPNKAFWCQYSMQFAEVVRGYHLSVDERSANAIRKATQTCPH
ncbi:membrane or exported protein [Mycobacteroides abscessus subsp. abscessus]|nr:membrane or exported protein [Mycobacteroides abscessus subsp. abscessus]